MKSENAQEIMGGGFSNRVRPPLQELSSRGQILMQSCPKLKLNAIPGDINRCTQRRMGQGLFQRLKQVQNLTLLWISFKRYTDLTD